MRRAKAAMLPVISATCPIGAQPRTASTSPQKPFDDTQPLPTPQVLSTASCIPELPTPLANLVTK